MSMKNVIAQLRKGLTDMATMYAERRSDVADMCDAILKGREANTVVPESRYVKWEYKGTDFVYDTLTTLVEADEDGGWEPIDNISYAG